MNLSKRILLPGTLGLLLVFSLTTSAQWDKKPYTEWTEKDAQKLLNESPWARTQSFDSPMELYRGPSSGRPGQTTTPDLPPNAVHLFFRVRFFSAKPVRQAITRQIELQQKGGVNEQLAAQLKQLASGDFLEFIVVVVTADATAAGPNVQQASALLRRNNAELKNSTFLEIKGGKRIFLQEFQPATPDGLGARIGARFIFPRLLDGKPFITRDSEEIHFYAQLSDDYKLDRRFKVKDMMYEGKLEY
jgi:hypothetical protein